MNKDKIAAVVIEAEKLLSRFNDLPQTDNEYDLWRYPRQTGAIRRASMELTRALAEMRKPG